MNEKIESTADEKVKELTSQKVGDILTEDFVKNLVLQKGEGAIESISKELQEKLAPHVDKVKTAAEKGLVEIRKSKKEYDEEYLIILEKTRRSVDINRQDSLSPEQSETLEEFKEALEQSKKEKEYSAEDWFWKGQLENTAGKYKQAIFSLSEAINLDPGNADIALHLAFAHNMLKNYKDSIKYSSQIIEIDEFSESAWINRGYAYNMTGKYNLALKDLTRSINLNSNNKKSRAHRAFSYIKLNELENAEKDNIKAYELDSNYDRTYYNKGIIHQKRGEIKEACDNWKKALELGFEDAQEKLNEFCK
ncbi:MAG: hypothetical protein JXR03_17720 [Cyclobacteriaceae bacterium]